ncbi:hypothetical protein [Campylobacter insulaenigrae]|nr:hypothetical protein [Campylobacter insulaenigrae]
MSVKTHSLSSLNGHTFLLFTQFFSGGIEELQLSPIPSPSVSIKSFAEDG